MSICFVLKPHFDYFFWNKLFISFSVSRSFILLRLSGTSFSLLSPLCRSITCEVHTMNFAVFLLLLRNDIEIAGLNTFKTKTWFPYTLLRIEFTGWTWKEIKQFQNDFKYNIFFKLLTLSFECLNVFYVFWKYFCIYWKK